MTDRDGLVEKLDEMQLHDDTGDPRDEGYMAAVNEMREFVAALAVVERERPDEDEWRYVPEYIEPHATCCDECKALRERPPLTEERIERAADLIARYRMCDGASDWDQPFGYWTGERDREVARKVLASSTTEEQEPYRPSWLDIPSTVPKDGRDRG